MAVQIQKNWRPFAKFQNHVITAHRKNLNKMAESMSRRFTSDWFIVAQSIRRWMGIVCWKKWTLTEVGFTNIRSSEGTCRSNGPWWASVLEVVELVAALLVSHREIIAANQKGKFDFIEKFMAFTDYRRWFQQSADTLHFDHQRSLSRVK
jgi:hypothetical protein